MVYIINKTRDTRSHDFKELRKQAQSSDPTLRRQAMETAFRISQESQKVRSMRESLVKAHREGNHAEIKDIHDFVSKHDEYKNK